MLRLSSGGADRHLVNTRSLLIISNSFLELRRSGNLFHWFLSITPHQVAGRLPVSKDFYWVDLALLVSPKAIEIPPA